MIKSKLSFRVKYIFMTTVLIIGLLAVNVSAGSNVTITSMLTQSGEFNSTDWFVPNDDLEFENNSLNFTEDGNEETRLISKTIATKDDSFENLLNVNARIKISGIPQGKSFILAVGLSSIDSLYSEAGNVEMHFKNNSGLTADIMAFDEDGKSTDIVSGKRCGISLNSYADVNLVISNGGVLKISVNGQGIIDTKLPFVPEGRIGILQNAQCVASVSKLEMTTYSYDRPENVNVKEDFESGYINANAFTSKMINSARIPALYRLKTIMKVKYLCSEMPALDTSEQHIIIRILKYRLMFRLYCVSMFTTMTVWNCRYLTVNSVYHSVMLQRTYPDRIISSQPI